MSCAICDLLSENEIIIYGRWEKGIPHHPKSIELFKKLQEIDWNFYGDYFSWKSGGDGDNGETLMYQLDMIFELEDLKNDKT